MGTEFWGGLLDWIKSTLVTTGKISPADVDLIHVTDDVDEAVRIITEADQNRGERLRGEQRAALNTIGDAQ